MGQNQRQRYVLLSLPGGGTMAMSAILDCLVSTESTITILKKTINEPNANRFLPQLSTILMYKWLMVFVLFLCCHCRQ